MPMRKRVKISVIGEISPSAAFVATNDTPQKTTATKARKRGMASEFKLTLMVQSAAKSVDAYLEELPPERRKVVAAVRDLIRRNLPSGYRESMGYGMVCYGIPLERYPDTYNKQPLSYVALAAQKNYYALYLMNVYGDPKKEKQLAEAFEKHGTKMDMGKSCLRFKKLEDLPLDAIGKLIASTPPEQMIAKAEAVKRK